jgi:hypothetical protein
MPNPTRLRRLLSAACLVVAPTLLVAAFVLAPFGSDDTSSEIVALVEHNQTAYTAVPVLLAVATLLLIPALMATIRLAGIRAPYLAYIGGSLAIAGYVSLLPTMMVEQTAMAMSRAGVPASTAASVLDSLSDGSLVLGILMGVFVAGHILGSTILGIALIRARVVALWAGGAVAVSQPLHFVAHIMDVKALDIVGFGLLAVGLFAVAAVILRIPDLAWDADPVATLRDLDRSATARTA